MCNIPLNRATGRTFRLCLEACLDASKGKHIFVTCNKDQQLNHVKFMIRDILQVIQGVQFKKNHIIFPGNDPGSINFAAKNSMSLDRYENLKHKYKVYKD